MPITTLVSGNTITAAGLNDNFSWCVTRDTAATITVAHTWTASQTFTGGWTAAAACTITSASASAFAVGLTGATNSAFLVDASTASQVAGLKVTGAATGGTVALVTTDSGAATNLTINAKGTGTIGIGSVSTGRVTITPVTTITGSLTLSAALVYGGVTLSNAVTGTGNMVLSAGPTLTGTLAAATITAAGTVTITAASATAFSVGRQGATDPVLLVHSSTASQATGISITGAAAAGGVAVAVISSGTNENLTIDAKGSGTITLGGTSTGAIVLTRATTLSAALTYGGVTLSNAVTGTGNMVLSASPTITGTITGAIANWSGLHTFNGGATVASGQTLTVTGATITGLTAASVGTGTFPSGAFVFAGAVSGVTTLGTSSTITVTGAGAVQGLLVVANTNAQAAYTSFKGGATTYWHTGLNVSASSQHYDIYDAVNSALAMSITGGAAPAVAFNGALSGITTLATSGNAGFGQAADGTYRIISKGAAVFKFLNADDGFTISQAGVNDWAIGQVVGSSIFRFNVDSVVFAGALSGITTLTGSGKISTTVTTATGAAFEATGATTDGRYLSLGNTGGNAYFAVEASVGGAVFTGSSAYAACLGHAGAHSLELFTNNALRLGIVGVAGTPANSSVGNIYIVNGTAPTGNPTGMGYLWVAGGALYYRGTSGTVTELAPA